MYFLYLFHQLLNRQQAPDIKLTILSTDHHIPWCTKIYNFLFQ